MKYFAFYTYAYGMRQESKEFAAQGDLLAFIKEAKADDSPYLGLRVIWGEEIDFEPATYVESYRIVKRAAAPLPGHEEST